MAVIYMDKESFNSLDENDIKRIYMENRYLNSTYRTLDNYYAGKHKIVYKQKYNANDPNNKIANNMCKYITDSMVGYFVGDPIKYNSQNDEYMEKIQNVLEYNDEQDENTEIAKKASIHGDCFEILYIDEDANIRFTKVPANEGILIRDSGGEDNYLGFIRIIRSYTKRKVEILKLEFSTSESTWYFESRAGGSLQLKDIVDHYWKDVPVVEFVNNEERIGDFEGIISIVDAYNTVQSNTANLFQYNDEALMKISKLGDVTTTDIQEMRKKGAIILDDGGDVSWMLKEINDTALENYKNRLVSDMHLFSSVPNMTDSAFASNLSGVAISYKMWSMDQVIAIKERKFKKSLQRRIELITNILNLFGGNYDYRDINVVFNRNRPQNKLENAQIAQMISPFISHQTLLSKLDDIENVQEELENIKEENEDEEVKQGVYQNLVKAFSLSEDELGE